MRITDLRCEHIPAQTGQVSAQICCIGRERPCFSFALEGDGNDTAVKYCKILVSSSQSLLSDGIGDMWDSGVIYSSDTRFIEYGGKPLRNKTTYYFRVFAMAGRTALKSRTGVFHYGMSYLSSWKCGFIGQSGDGGDNGKTLYFKRGFEVKRAVRRAYAYAASSGLCTLYINGKEAGKVSADPDGGSIRYGFFEFSSYLVRGNNEISASVAPEGGMSAGLMLHADVEYDDGSASVIVTDGGWSVSDKPEAGENETLLAVPFMPDRYKGLKPEPAAGRVSAAPCAQITTSDPELDAAVACESLSRGVHGTRPLTWIAVRDADMYFQRVRELYASQLPDGSFRTGGEDNGVFALGADAYDNGADAFYLPYALYMTYSDLRVLAENYPGMEKYFDFLKSTSEGYIRQMSGGEEKSAEQTALFASDALIMELISETLGSQSRAEYYKKIYEQTRAAWYETFAAGEKSDIPRSAYIYALAYRYGLGPAGSALDGLVSALDGGATPDGDSLPLILSVLCGAGRYDAAYKLIKDNAAKLPDLTSWALSYPAGIRPDKPGFAHTVISPCVGFPVSTAEGSYKSVSGTVSAGWRKTENGAEIKVTVPPNTSATVSVPGYVITRTDRQKPVQSVECRPGTFTFYAVRSEKEALV